MYSDRDLASTGQGSGQLGSIVAGTAVYDASGGKLGSVREYDPRANYLVVHKGLFFPNDLYVPTDAIERTTADGVFLNLDKNSLEDQRYSSPPQMPAPLAAASGVGASATLDGDVDRVNMRRTATTSGAGVDAKAAPAPTPAPRPTGEQDIVVPLPEEELVAEKRRGEVGRVHVRKDVVEEPQTLSVPITHEEVHVEHVPVDRDLPPSQLSADVFQERDIDVPVMGEQVTAEKQAHAAEEVRLHKQAVTENERLSGTVRKERAEVSAEPADLVPEYVDGNLDNPPHGGGRTGQGQRHRRKGQGRRPRR